MEIFFLDVAQGTCQIILLGKRRAIVMDGGLIVDRLNDHQRAVDQLSLISNGCPLCRIPSNEV